MSSHPSGSTPTTPRSRSATTTGCATTSPQCNSQAAPTRSRTQRTPCAPPSTSSVNPSSGVTTTPTGSDQPNPPAGQSAPSTTTTAPPSTSNGNTPPGRHSAPSASPPTTTRATHPYPSTTSTR